MSTPKIKSPSNVPDDIAVLNAEIEKVLLIMVPVSANAWIVDQTVSRTFTQSEYETIRNVLFACKELTRSN